MPKTCHILTISNDNFLSMLADHCELRKRFPDRGIQAYYVRGENGQLEAVQLEVTGSTEVSLVEFGKKEINEIVSNYFSSMKNGKHSGGSTIKFVFNSQVSDGLNEPELTLTVEAQFGANIEIDRGNRSSVLVGPQQS